ncbi:hypothetical protein [Halomarina pelagica]|uniref:hypothetical protein n=1 Tax=Halomarina pelagica TaxID=2961599 RepID=UPI0020C23B32|nr:hypothetical protein [Halomarina sp. BND7]
MTTGDAEIDFSRAVRADRPPSDDHDDHDDHDDGDDDGDASDANDANDASDASDRHNEYDDHDTWRRRDRELAVDGLRPGDRIEHDDGRTWHVVAATTRTVRVRMPDDRQFWIPRDSLRRQLRDEPVAFVPAVPF